MIQYSSYVSFALSFNQIGADPLNMRRRVNHHFLHLLLLCAAGLAVVLLLYGGLHWFERHSSEPEPRGDHTQRRAYEDELDLNGVSYHPRDLCTILLMGIDRDSTAQVSGYRNGGQADFLQLIVIDRAEKTIHRVQIDRDTMTPITILGVLGNQSGMRTAQIALSHGFGDGQEQSCIFTVDAVSNLLFGFPIDFYIAMNMDGISVLNDLAGGVTVTLEDDFSALDAHMTPGTILTLMGDQAEYYVRNRLNIGVGTNEARMARQEQYISQLTELLVQKITQDKDFIGEIYDQLSPYLITNMGRGRLINEVWAARDYTRTPLIRPVGTHLIGSDGFMQFHADETALQRIAMTLQYQK